MWNSSNRIGFHHRRSGMLTRHYLTCAIGGIYALVSGCGIPISDRRAGQGEGQANSENAGPAVVQPPSTTGKPPSAAELDQRERMLTGPRPPAGPPLR
jgi:hypothetical protein